MRVPSSILFGGLIATFSTLAASAVTILNPSFEDDDASSSPFFIRSATAPTGWTQFNDGADLVHNTYTQAPTVLVDAHTGTQFIDLNQAATGGGLYQDVNVLSGQAYRLTFVTSQWATNSSGSINYSLIDPGTMNVLNSGSFGVVGSVGWVEQTLDATATSGSLRIQFTSSGEFQAAPGLDSVSLDQIPEPSSSVLLLGSGLLFAAKRKRKTPALT